MTRRLTINACAALLLSCGSPVLAQSERRVEVGVGVRWLAGVSLGDVDAKEIAFGGATRTVFKASTRFGQTLCPDGRATVSFGSRFDVEGSAAFCKTHLATALTADAEAAEANITESLTESLFEGGILAHPARWRRGRAMRFVSAGGGVMRQLHEGHTLAQSGAVGYVGGGLRFSQSDPALHGRKSAGLRVELRATILTGGLTPAGGVHVVPTIVAGLSFRP